MLRNRRTVIFTLVMPAAFFFLFGYRPADPAARAYVLVSLARLRRDDRHDQWRRDGEHRARPGLEPPAAAHAAAPGRVHRHQGRHGDGARPRGGRSSSSRSAPRPASELTAEQWIVCGLVAWLGALVFAAFGLFAGYLLPSENVMQILGPVLAILAFAGGLFVPLQFLDPARADDREADARLRPRRARPHAAHARRLQTGRAVANIVALARPVRRRRRAALPPRHAAGLTCPTARGAAGTTATVVPVARPELSAGVAVPSGDEAGRAVARGRLGWLFAAIWLVYLVPVLQEALRRPNGLERRRRRGRGRRLQRRVRVVLLRLRRWRRHGWGVPTRPGGSACSALSVALFAIAAVTVGMQALAMLVFVAVQSVFVLPRRAGLIGAAACVLVAVALAPAARLVADGRRRVLGRARLDRHVGRDRDDPAQRRARAGAGDDRRAGRAERAHAGSPATCTTSSATRSPCSRSRPSWPAGSCRSTRSAPSARSARSRRWRGRRSPTSAPPWPATARSPCPRSWPRRGRRSTPAGHRRRSAGRRRRRAGRAARAPRLGGP